MKFEKLTAGTKAVMKLQPP